MLLYKSPGLVIYWKVWVLCFALEVRVLYLKEQGNFISHYCLTFCLFLFFKHGVRARSLSWRAGAGVAPFVRSPAPAKKSGSGSTTLILTTPPSLQYYFICSGKYRMGKHLFLFNYQASAQCAVWERLWRKPKHTMSAAHRRKELLRFCRSLNLTFASYCWWRIILTTKERFFLCLCFFFL